MDYKDYNDFELISFIAEGNEDARNIILEKYKPLIKNVSTKFLSVCQNNGLELSDLEQEGTIGLMKAISTFDEQKDVVFYTYAKTCIKRSIISAIVKSKRLKHKILNDSLSFDSDDVSENKLLKDDINNPENIIIDTDYADYLIHKMENKLTDFEAQVFQLMVSGFNYKEIADILEKDYKSIDNTMQRIKRKLKGILKSQDN